MVTINLATGKITAVWNSLCSDRHTLIDPPKSCPASDSAIWGRDGAVIEPGTGRMLVATGNAPFNGSTDWGDSVLELSPDGSRLLHNWTPTDQAHLNSDDLDLGSTSPAVLPVFHGHRLAIQGGKAGVLDLLDLDRLDGTTGGPGPAPWRPATGDSGPGADHVFTRAGDLDPRRPRSGCSSRTGPAPRRTCSTGASRRGYRWHGSPGMAGRVR